MRPLIPEWPETQSLGSLVSELGLMIGFDTRCNQEFETFIARLDPAAVKVDQLKTTLAFNLARTERLSLLYHIIHAMDEATLRALYARARADLQRGKAA